MTSRHANMALKKSWKFHILLLCVIFLHAWLSSTQQKLFFEYFGVPVGIISFFVVGPAPLLLLSPVSIPYTKKYSYSSGDKEVDMPVV